jgi:uridine kinase
VNAVNFDPDEAADAIVSRVLEFLDAGVATPIVLIDGRAGSGKSTLADAVQSQLFREGDSLPRVVHMDDLYLGWDGLQAGVDYLMRFVLGPVSRNKLADWQEYDWALGERNRWREFSGGTPLIIEGCGALSAAAAELANLRVWFDVPEPVRRDRWIQREGHRFDDKWAVWAAQELDFYAREKSAELADFVVRYE